MKNMKRAGSYPIQSSEYAPSVTTARTLSVEENNARLPASVRALKDSKATNSHSRTVVICLDGTGDRFDGDNSNVVHFVSCLRKHTPDQYVPNIAFLHSQEAYMSIFMRALQMCCRYTLLTIYAFL